MAPSPTIRQIRIAVYRYPRQDLTVDLGFAAGAFYEPGSVVQQPMLGVRIVSDTGVTGEYLSAAPGALEQIRMFAPFLIGKDALQRELFYNQAKYILRKHDRIGIGPIDIALWDLAGKLHQAPIYRLLGGYRTKLPVYASTFHADRQPDGLSSPQGYADFAAQCREMGYRAFKIHSWGDPVIEREIETVQAVRDRVGDSMALMLDPCCAYDTYGDALRVGRALDDAGYFWYEDPLKDGGVSFAAHRRLRAALRTPLLQGEHLHLVEAHTDMGIADATDFWRADPDLDGGITGVMKIAHAAEGMGADVEIHGAGPAHRHCMAAMRNSNFYELTLVHPKVYGFVRPNLSGYADLLDAIDSEGCMDVPQGPGLGVEWDWEHLRGYQVDEIVID